MTALAISVLFHAPRITDINDCELIIVLLLAWLLIFISQNELNKLLHLDLAVSVPMSVDDDYCRTKRKR
jgi:hypothetical protein